MKCIQCGKEIDDDLKFCPYCGTKQTRTEPSVKQLNEGPNVNYHKEDNSRLNQYLTKISSGKMTAISGIINGIFILVMVYIVSKLINNFINFIIISFFNTIDPIAFTFYR